MAGIVRSADGARQEWGSGAERGEGRIQLEIPSAPGRFIKLNEDRSDGPAKMTPRRHLKRSDVDWPTFLQGPG